MNVMIVDDEWLALKMMEKLLEEYNGNDLQFDEVIALQDPYKAIEVAERKTLHLAFLDISMLDIDGFELAERLLNIQPHLHIVFVTAYQGYAVKAFELNVLDYLMKPVHPMRLALTIDRIVKLQQTKVTMSTSDDRTSVSVCSLSRLHYIDREGNAQLFSWKTSKAAELFAYFIYKRDKTISKEALIDLLWPEYDFEKSNAQLHTTIYQIRKIIRIVGLDLEVKFLDRGYRLVWGNQKLDVEEWENRIRSAPPLTPKTLQQHLAILAEYTGDYFGEHQYTWTHNEQERLRLLWLDHAKKIAEYYDLFGNTTEAILLYQKIIEKLPLLEDGYFGLMKIYASLNYVSMVRDQFQLISLKLSEEIGVAPSKELIDWYEQWGQQIGS